MRITNAIDANQETEATMKYETKRMFVFIFIWGTLLSLHHISAAEFVTIKGRIVEATTGNPLANANITIENTQLGAASDADGIFTIKNVPLDLITVKASYIGFEPSVISVDLRKYPEQFLEFKLRDGFFHTEQVVVTATRTQKLMENVPVVTELITETDIKDAGAQNLAQVLEDRPGITIEEGVAGGKTLRMCGIDAKYVLVLLDGSPIAGKFNNRQELHLINSNQIDHIEIVKGPSSALYGSEAMGGVINVITKGVTENFSLEAQGKTGSFDLYNGSARVAGRTNNFSYSLNLDHTRGGIDKNEISINVTDTQASHVGGKLTFDQTKWGRYEIGLNYNFDQQHGQDPIFRTGTDVNRNDGYLSWKKAFAKKFEFSSRFFGTDNKREYTEIVRHSGNVARVDETSEIIWGVKNDASYHFCDYSKVDVGYDYSVDDYNSERIYNNNYTRIQHGMFLHSETQLLNKKLTLIAGGRYDDISGVGTHVGPRVSAMLAPTTKLKFRGSWGSGFRAPSFTDMYIDYNNVFIGYRVEGNADLMPEKSVGTSFGIEYFWNYLILTNVTVYQNRFQDLILDYVKGPGVLSYKNVDSATFSNIEFQSKLYLLNNLSSTISYNYTKVSQASDTDAMLNISPHQGALKLNWSFAKYFRLSLRDNLYGDRNVRVFDRRTGRYLDDQLTVKRAYHLFDATLNWKTTQHLFASRKNSNSTFNNALSMRFGVTNIADYTDAHYGPWIGRRYFVSFDVEY
jgi:outer membrane receptor for ferrienterochelin and colicins